MLRSVFVLSFFTLVGGVVYPLAVTGVARLTFPAKAAGDPDLVGRAWAEPRDFFGRPSATTPPYNAAASTGSNLGPLNPALREAVAGRVAALKALDPGNAAKVPVELVTASGSGLDPHVTPQGAAYQVPRVARLRGLAPERVAQLVAEHTEPRTFGVLGEPRVNVRRLNAALNALQVESADDRAAATPRP
ncbi:MAG: potassium-transporting ATPase subunit KdpC [Myxococcaceae bacterium]|nr:potassium-transporting ATPase subunit KdpC [Myxococcaceae bacterium]